MYINQKQLGFVAKFASVILVLLSTSSVFAIPILNPTNGHYYDTVVFASLGDTSWTTSKTLAEGLGGYLVTVTSASEQTFLEANIGTGAWWAGGSDSATEDVWEWVTGPEAGTQFWQGKSVSLGGHTTAPFNYAKWFANEPNSSGEDFLSWNNNGGGTFGWNDVGVTNAIMKGFIIEYDNNPAEVPEPTTLALIGLGLAGLGFSRRKKQ